MSGRQQEPERKARAPFCEWGRTLLPKVYVPLHSLFTVSGCIPGAGPGHVAVLSRPAEPDNNMGYFKELRKGRD